jgi:hypothetical protein
MSNYLLIDVFNTVYLSVCGIKMIIYPFNFAFRDIQLKVQAVINNLLILTI